MMALSGRFTAARVPADVLHSIWVQYAINAGLLPPMVRAGGLRELLHDRDLGYASIAAARECLQVVAAGPRRKVST